MLFNIFSNSVMRAIFCNILTAKSSCIPYQRCVSSIAKGNKIPQGNMVDRVRIHARGGGGGQGIKRLGKIGGQGGNVFAIAEEKTNLEEVAKKYKHRFTAKNGKNAKKEDLLAKEGESLYIKVPLGTVIWQDDRIQLADLQHSKACVKLVDGGNGGGPATHFWRGESGQRAHFILELKLIGDTGLVGYPNAGKSTFLTAVSRAVPKIASYPFTTIRPHVGVVQFPDTEPPPKRISIADLPGLIDGAHLNRGMGHKFLRHIERTKCLLFIVDINGYQHSHEFPLYSPFQSILNLSIELELYKPGLASRPAILLVNKMDTPGAEDKYEELMNELGKRLEVKDGNMIPNFEQLLPISAKDKIGTEMAKIELKSVIQSIINKEEEEMAKFSPDEEELDT